MTFMATSVAIAALQWSSQYPEGNGKPETMSKVNPSGNGDLHDEI